MVDDPAPPAPLATKPPRPQNAHLIPVRPGEVRNPTGRAKGELYPSEVLRMLLRGVEPPENAPPVWSVAQNWVRAMQDERLDGRLLSLAMDRLEGKVPDRLEATVAQGVVFVPAARMEADAWTRLAQATLQPGSPALDAQIVETARELQAARVEEEEEDEDGDEG